MSNFLAWARRSREERNGEPKLYICNSCGHELRRASNVEGWLCQNEDFYFPCTGRYRLVRPPRINLRR